MKRLYSFALTVIIVLTVPQMGNSSVSATNLQQWRELISSLDPHFNKNLNFSAEKKPAKSGWQSSEPKLVKRAPRLIIGVTLKAIAGLEPFNVFIAKIPRTEARRPIVIITIGRMTAPVAPELLAAA